MQTLNKIVLPGDVTKFLNGRGEWVTLAPPWGGVQGQIESQEDLMILLDRKAPSVPSFKEAWPVGSIFMTAQNINPAILLGFGTWMLHSYGQLTLT